MANIIIFDKDIYINNHPVLRINSDIDIRTLENDDIFKNIDNVINLTKQEYNNGLCKEKFIILVDFSKLNKDDVDISKIKSILKYVLNKYSNNLEKCVIYNYTIFWKFLINIIMGILDKETKKKICFKKNLQI